MPNKGLVLSAASLAPDYDVLVVAGGLGAPLIDAIPLLASLKKPVFVVLSPSDCPDGDFSRAQTLAKSLALGSAVCPLLRECAVHEGVMFLGAPCADSTKAEDLEWVASTLAAHPGLPAVVITACNPEAAQDSAFLKGHSLPAPSSLSRQDAHNCYAWIYGGAKIESMRLLSNGVCMVACQGFLTRPAFGPLPEPFNVYEIREHLQALSLRPLLSELRRYNLQLKNSIKLDAPDLEAVEGIRRLLKKLAEAPFLSERVRNATAQGLTCISGSIRDIELPALLTWLLSFSMDEVVIDRVYLNFVRQVTIDALERWLAEDGVSIVATPLSHPDSYKSHLQPLNLRLVGLTAASEAEMLTYTNRLVDGVHHWWRGSHAFRFYPSQPGREPLALILSV